MPREIITLQVGQCGNQIGCRFWELALREHAAANKGGRYDEALSSFFANVDARTEPPTPLPLGDGRGAIRTLRARAVLVDMEEGVVGELLRGPLGAWDVFDPAQLISGVSGSGNNWACGARHYGPKYHEALMESVRRPVEACDSLQSFLLLHSLGGGTGSGLGSYLLGALADEYPDVFRFTASVFPAEDDDVVTSPYNSALSAAQLIEHADAVLPMDNGALGDACAAIAARAAKASLAGARPKGGADGGKGSKPFDAMNGLAANALLHLTSSMRFEGPLNVDLNEITMNLVPFPRMHFLLSSMAPLVPPVDVAAAGSGRGGGGPVPSRTVDALFADAFSREAQLLRADPRRSTYLAAALLLRGPVTLSDIHRNAARLSSGLRMAPWNTEGFKIGLCATPPPGVPASLFVLSNSSCVGATLGGIAARYGRLRARSFYLHHYAEYMEVADMDAAAEQVAALAAEYSSLEGPDGGAATAPPPERLAPLGVGLGAPRR